MKMEQELYRGLVNDIVEDQKKLKELKQQILAKKITAKMLKKKADKNPLPLPNQFINEMKYKMTAIFARINARASEALSEPGDYAANKLSIEARKLLEKAQKISDNTNKKANKVAIRCAEMVMLLEEAAEDKGLSTIGQETLIRRSEELDEQVQRLRPNKKENELCSVQQSPCQCSLSQDACSSMESSLEESESSLRSTPCSQTC